MIIQSLSSVTGSQWMLIFLSAALIGMAKGGVKGAGMLAVPLMAGIYGGKASTGIVLPMLVMADVMAVKFYNRDANWRFIWRLIPAAAAGILLAMVVGIYINDELFNYLKDRVSVHSAGKIDVNRASAEVLATLVKAASLDMAIQDAGACGEQSESRDLMENLLEAYAQLIVDARSHIKIIKMLGKPFKGPQGVRDFIAVAKDPIQRVLDNPITPDQVLNPVLYAERMAQRRGMTLAVYMQLKDRLAPFFDGLASSITTDSNLYRLRARGRVGNISRTIYAVIKKDGATVRTLYYREE